MSKSLVIIESPGKIKKYKEYLGSDYEIVSCFGHCVDLPEKSLAVDIKNGFAPTFEVKAEKQSVLNDIVKLAKKCSTIYLMGDPDFEGCAISKHIGDYLSGKISGKILRASTSEITKQGITQAINNAGAVDEDVYAAYLSRRILDRIVGYKTSFLTQQATGGRSAGRVQSVILRIIADREEEILNFKPEEYWILTADLLSNKGDAYTAKLGVYSDKFIIPNEKMATEIYDKVLKGNPFVSSVDYKEVKSYANPPFTTMKMIASASSILGWNVDRTMDVAQKVYESGKSTYHRTDSVAMSTDAMGFCRQAVVNGFGKDYLYASAKIYSSNKGSQEAHECIRPTDFALLPQCSGLSGDEAKLYELIWRRAVASQMVEGVDGSTKVVTDIAGYGFITRGSVTVFDGHRKCWNYSDSKDSIVPKLTKGEKCTLKCLDKEQNHTKPPSRFSDASLAKRCEDEQIARPATFKNFIKTLTSRGYISRVAKSFHATDLGMKVTKFLKDAGMCFVDISFTKNMEELLDLIADKKKTRLEVLQEFWERLQKDIAKGKEIRLKAQETNFNCPKCNGKLLLKCSKFGQFFSCANYKAPSKSKKAKKVVEKIEPTCSYIANLGPCGEPVEKVKKEVQYASFECQKCSGKMILRTGKKDGTSFYGCENYFKSGCRCTADVDGNFKEPSASKPKKWKKWTKK